MTTINQASNTSNQVSKMFHVIIPARYDSSRLPGKPLKNIAGKTMIERVYNCALLSKAQSVVVATDDQRIADEVARFGGRYVMTQTQHESGTDRLQEAAQILGLQANDVVVNVQGDEPMIPAEVINQVAFNLFNNKQASASTLSELIQNPGDVFNPNIVKVVCDDDGMALYFSRAPIPWERDRYTTAHSDIDHNYSQDSTPNAQNGSTHKNSEALNKGANIQRPASLPCSAMRHIGIYAYRVSLLNKFVNWTISPLEKIEKLEQLRVLTGGHKIHVEQACMTVPGGVDTEDDLQRVSAAIKN